MRVVARVLAGTLVAVLLGALLVGVVGWARGYRVYVVHTGSMVPALVPGDAVLDGPAQPPVPGQVVTFRLGGPDGRVTHRVVSTVDGIVHTKGDGNATVDPWVIKPDDVVGTMQARLPRVGFLLVYLRTPAGLASLLTSLLALALLWRVFFPKPVESVAEEEPAEALPEVPADEEPADETADEPVDEPVGHDVPDDELVGAAARTESEPARALVPVGAATLAATEGDVTVTHGVEVAPDESPGELDVLLAGFAAPHEAPRGLRAMWRRLRRRPKHLLRGPLLDWTPEPAVPGTARWDWLSHRWIA